MSLSKAERSRYTLQLVSTRGELCPILPQSASWHDAGGRNPHSNHLCRSTVRFGSKNRLRRSRKRGPRDAGALRVSFSLILGLVFSFSCFSMLALLESL